MSENIVLTTGIYDLIKDHVRRKRTTKEEEELLTTQLKNAQQVLRRDLPEDVVTVNTKVKLRDVASGEEKEYLFVPPAQHKVKKGKYSIVSDVALATVGHRSGAKVRWPFADGERQLEILSVEPLA